MTRDSTASSAPRSILVRAGLACAVGVGLAWLVGELTNPWNFIADDAAVALVSDTCPISHELLDSIGAFEEVRAFVVPIAIDEESPSRFAGFREAACSHTVAHVQSRAVWLRLASESWLCEQLIRRGARLHREQFVGVPSFLVDGYPAHWTLVDKMLERRGLTRRRGLIVPADRLPGKTLPKPAL